MTTTATKPKKRYEQAHQEQAEAQKLIQQALYPNTDEFYSLEFETGLNVLEAYFSRMDAWIQNRYKKRLRLRKKYGYWDWFINQKRQADYAWYTEHMSHYLQLIQSHEWSGMWELRALLRNSYEHHLRAWAAKECDERMYHFIMQNKAWKL